MKYFFKSTKMKKKAKKDIEKENSASNLFNEKSEIINSRINTKPMETYMSEKKYYTIEDLVVIYSMLEDGKKKYQNLLQDIKAMELKYQNLKR